MFYISCNRTILVLVNTIELTAVKTAILIKESYGLQYTFLIPAVAILCSAIYAALFMPETHGLERKEIAKIYADPEREEIKVRIRIKMVFLDPFSYNLFSEQNALNICLKLFYHL